MTVYSNTYLIYFKKRFHNLKQCLFEKKNLQSGVKNLNVILYTNVIHSFISQGKTKLQKQCKYVFLPVTFVWLSALEREHQQHYGGTHRAV